MIVNSLHLNGFRNLSGRSLRFGGGKNLIFGANGSGKTSVIEALHVLGFGKSFLPVSRRELVQFGRDGFFLQAGITSASGDHHLSAIQEQRFLMQLDGVHTPLARVSRTWYPLFFSHFSFSLAIDSHPHLRRMVDRFVYGLDSLYFHDILRYNAVLKQKSFLLKRQGKALDQSELNGWNALIAEAGSNIIEKRMLFTAKLNTVLHANQGRNLSVSYAPCLDCAPAAAAGALREALERARASEIRGRRCLVGPQRDHFEITVGRTPLKMFSSGEKKKHLLMVYMAFLELFHRQRGEFPVLLIDDYDAAMDPENLQQVLDCFPDLQVIATSVACNDRFECQFELSKET